MLCYLLLVSCVFQLPFSCKFRATSPSTLGIMLATAALLSLSSATYQLAPAIHARTGLALARTSMEQPQMNAALLTLDAIEPAVSSYVAIWTPLFEGAKAAGIAPEWLLHWGHGGAMATGLFAMGGYGAFLGWQTRFGNGNTVYPLTLGETARELHPKLMGAALFFFLLGGQGGLVLLATAGQPILQSAHSSTAVIGIALLIAQAGEP